MSADLHALLNPSSVAILGATEGEHRIGGRVMRFMHESGFAGPIYPVNPRRETVQGKRAYPTVAAIPGDAQCAILAVPANAVLSSLESCAQKGVKAAVIFSSGFAEAGAQGNDMQTALVDFTKHNDLRVLGPNCLGAFSAHSGFIGTFSSNLLDAMPKPGPVGIVSQSGAFGAHLYSLARSRGIGVSYWVTTGNEVDITLSECVAYMAKADDVNTIMVYAEGINDAPGLMHALALARDAHKPVIFLKVGRTEIGAKAAQSHTASMAVSDRVVDALLRQHAAHRAQSTEEMIEIAYACQAGVFPVSRKLAILSMSGGVGVQLADAAIHNGLQVDTLSESTQAGIKALLPLAATSNPVDLTGTVMERPECLHQALTLLLADPACDAVASFVTPIAAQPDVMADLCHHLEQYPKRHPNTPIGICMPAGTDVRETYERHNAMVFETPDQLIGAFAALARFKERFEHGVGEPPPAAPVDAKPLPLQPSDEFAAKRLLAGWGVPVVQEAIAADREGAIRAAAAIDGPVVLKIASPDIAHKSEFGGVLLNVAGDTAVGDGYDTLMARARSAHANARLHGVIIARHAPPGVETVIGVNNDPTFGPMVLFGLGGVLIEVLDDVSMRRAPFGKAEAHRMMRELKGFEIFTGVRGRPSVDLDAIAETLTKVSVFAAANAERLQSLDINPFLALPDGALALDALICVRA